MANNAARDRASFAALREALGADATLMADANQAWSYEQALARIAELAPEVDANPNPLREEVLPLRVADGWATLPDAPGLGVEPDLARLRPYIVSI